MFKPELYGNINGDTIKESLECLKKFGSLLKGGEGSRVIDIGCGDGSVTARVLRPFLSSDFGMLLGGDIGPEMVAHANARYGDQRTKFIVLDMTAELSPDLIGDFDHVFSSYAVHWAQDQEKTFSNIYSMLKVGGNCLLIFPGHTRMPHIYRALMRHPRWQDCLRDAEKYISPYRDMQEPDKFVHKVMLDVGFKNITIDYETKSYLYEEDLFRDTMLAICPFKIPADRTQQFMDDYMQVARDMGIVAQTEGKTIVNNEYTLVTARGSK